MTNAEFKKALKEVFNTHMFMDERDQHTVNELLHCLRYEGKFSDLNINISIHRTNGEFWSIPTIDTFVNIDTLGVWFDDETVEYEVEEIHGEEGQVLTFDCITIYEIEEK